MNERADSVCACLTPLHVMIAQRIAESNRATFDAGLYLTSVDNAKQRHYANAMLRFCARVEYLVVPGEDSYFRPKHLSMWLRRLRYRVAFMRFGPAGTVYLPSSLNHYLYLLLSAIDFGRLVTYDDGLLNVNPGSPLFALRTSPRTKAYYLAAGITFWPERIRARAAAHYSIYDMENVCARALRIHLLGDPAAAAERTGTSEPAKLLLGSAPEVGPEAWQALACAARRFGIAAYLPHPRERQRMLDAVHYVETPLVAEDYVISQLQTDPRLTYQVYGYDSTALINLARTPRIESFSLLGNSGATSGLRSLMEKGGVVMLEQRA